MMRPGYLAPTGPEHGFVGGWEGLVVAYEAAELGQPGEGAFHDSAAVEQDNALGLVGALDDRHGQVPDLARVTDEPAWVPGVGPHQGDRGERLAQRGSDAERTVAVLQGGGRDHDDQQQPAGVDRDVPLAALDLLPAVVPAAGGRDGVSGADGL